MYLSIPNNHQTFLHVKTAVLHKQALLIKKTTQNKHHTDKTDQCGCSLERDLQRTHFSPGISNRLVSPVQLMSSFYETDKSKDM